MEKTKHQSPLECGREIPEHEAAQAARLVALARAKGPLDLALGQGLDALTVGDRLLREGSARLADFAREHLGLSRSSALGLLRLARELRGLPRLRTAVLSGALGRRRAVAVLPFARELPDAALVAIAHTHDVRRLDAMARALGRGVEEPLEAATLFLKPDHLARVAEALTFAGRAVGVEAADWRRHEALCQEFVTLGTTPLPGEDARPDLEVDLEAWLASWRAFGREEEECTDPDVGGADSYPFTHLPHEFGEPNMGGVDNGPFTHLPHACSEPNLGGADSGPFTHLPPGSIEPDVAALLPAVLATIEALPLQSAPDAPVPAAATPLRAHLVRLARARARWGVAFGRLAREVRRTGAWRALAPNWGDFCRHALGLHPRTVTDRIRFEAALERMPAIEAALLRHQITYSAAKLVARHARPETVMAALAEARDVPVLDLRNRAQAEHRRKMCEQGRVPLVGPASLMAFVADVIVGAQVRSVALGQGRIGAGEAYAQVADHFTDVWRRLAPAPKGRRGRVLTRNGGLCLVPGCSGAAQHEHHIVFESHGGPTTDWNMAGICAARHLRGVHLGYMRIRGRADGTLVFELGLRDGRPVEVYRLEAGDVPRREPTGPR